MKRKFQSFVSLVIKCRVPHTLVSWPFLVPGSSPAERMHRAGFLGAWKDRPLLLRLFIHVYSLGLWFAWNRRRQIAVAWRNQAVEVRDRFQIPLCKRALDLCNLVLLDGISPHFYYRYGLLAAHAWRKVVCVGTMLRTPRPDNRDLWWLMPVDIDTGAFAKPTDMVMRPQNTDDASPPEIAERRLPCWVDAVQSCLRAHEPLAEVTAIGWEWPLHGGL